MIRIGLPPPVLPRLRLHWHVTRTQFARQSRALREYATRTRESSRAWWQRAKNTLAAPFDLRARRAARRREQLAAFEEKYEALVDLLCWAAKDGVHTDRDARYGELRAWMQTHYRFLCPALRPYWPAPDAEHDPFEALFASDNVDDVINAATGIEDMMMTRVALDAYREALETRNS